MRIRTEHRPRRARAVRRRASLALGFFLLAWCVAGCGGSFGGGDGVIGDLERGERAYDKGHYQDAILHFERFQQTQPGSRFMDKALYLLGKSHQGQREYLLASDTFRRLMVDYPQSEYYEEAAFEIGMSAYRRARGPDYGPMPIEDAIVGFRQYLIEFPEGAHVDEARSAVKDLQRRLSLKACKNAETYMKLNKPVGAQLYFEKALGYRMDIDTVPRCLLGLARALEKQGDGQGALGTYRRLEEWLQSPDAAAAGLDAERIDDFLGTARERIQSLDIDAPGDSSSLPLSGGTD